MLKTTDQRCFFTHKNNYPQLIEFARTCEAEISVVKTRNVKVMELGELAKSICNHGKQSQNPQYEVMEVKLGPLPELKTGRTRKRLLAQANAVSSYVKDLFRKNKIVSLAVLENKFSEFGLSKPALCNHIARVRSEMAKEGYTISKIKRGSYQMTKPKLD
jgi:hypothetical protein